MPTIATLLRNQNVVHTTPQRIQGTVQIPRHYDLSPIILKSIATFSLLNSCAEQISIRFTNTRELNAYSNISKTISFYLKKFSISSNHFFPDILLGTLPRGNVEVKFEIEISSKNPTFTIPSEIYFVILIDDIDM